LTRVQEDNSAQSTSLSRSNSDSRRSRLKTSASRTFLQQRSRTKSVHVGEDDAEVTVLSRSGTLGSRSARVVDSEPGGNESDDSTKDQLDALGFISAVQDRDVNDLEARLTAMLEGAMLQIRVDFAEQVETLKGMPQFNLQKIEQVEAHVFSLESARDRDNDETDMRLQRVDVQLQAERAACLQQKVSMDAIEERCRQIEQRINKQLSSIEQKRFDDLHANVCETLPNESAVDTVASSYSVDASAASTQERISRLEADVNKTLAKVTALSLSESERHLVKESPLLGCSPSPRIHTRESSLGNCFVPSARSKERHPGSGSHKRPPTPGQHAAT